MILSLVLFNDGNPETPIDPGYKLEAAFEVTRHCEKGNKIYCGRVAVVDPSLSFHPNKSIGLDDLLNSSTNSDSGKPNTGVGSAINSLTITSLGFKGDGTKYKKPRVTVGNVFFI